MSTKVTVSHERGSHHLYADLFEPGVVYLRLEGVAFEATPGSLTVAIPAGLWERLRGHGRGEFAEAWDEDDTENDRPPTEGTIHE